jgi:hypothetical protein
VKSIGQKYKSNRALGNFDGSPNPRTQPKDPLRGLPLPVCLPRVFGVISDIILRVELVGFVPV